MPKETSTGSFSNTHQMAIYHLAVSVISRGAGQSAIASAAYRAGAMLRDNRLDKDFDYTRKGGIEHSEILAPENAPDWATDRERLWNEVEKAENRKDAQLARQVEVALPKELGFGKQLELVREFVKEYFVDQGMIADFSLHDLEKHNPHTHIMLTTREVGPEGFGKKVRAWNGKDRLLGWRESWAEHANKALALDYLSHHQAVFSRNDIAKFVNFHTLDREQFDRAVTAIEKHPELVRLGRGEDGIERYSSKEMISAEAKMLNSVERLSQNRERQVREKYISQASTTRQLNSDVGRYCNVRLK